MLTNDHALTAIDPVEFFKENADGILKYTKQYAEGILEENVNDVNGDDTLGVRRILADIAQTVGKRLAEYCLELNASVPLVYQYQYKILEDGRRLSNLQMVPYEDPRGLKLNYEPFFMFLIAEIPADEAPDRTTPYINQSQARHRFMSQRYVGFESKDFQVEEKILPRLMELLLVDLPYILDNPPQVVYDCSNSDANQIGQSYFFYTDDGKAF
jgi:hypothetical protein